MKNVYSISGHSSSNNVTTNEITTSSLTINGGTKGDVLIIADNNGMVDGIALGSTNHVFVANAGNNGLPGYTDALNINTLTSNDIKINGVLTGDLLVGSTGDFIQRLPIGASGLILTSNGSNVQWQPLDLPDPLILQDLEVTQSVKLGFIGEGLIYLDGSNNVKSIRNNFLQEDGSITMGGSQITVSSFNFNALFGRPYLISVNFNVEPNNNITPFTLRINGSNVRTYLNITSSPVTLSKIFIAPFNNQFNAQLLGGPVLPGTSNALNFTWSSTAMTN